MVDSKPREMQTSLRSRLADKWRFLVIMMANVWLVFVIMRCGIARQEQGPLTEYSLTTTFVASTALVATVLGFVTGVLIWRRSRANGQTRLVVYRGEDVPLDSKD
jgi:cytochrome b subunit of formate dehydrogenase